VVSKKKTHFRHYDNIPAGYFTKSEVVSKKKTHFAWGRGGMSPLLSRVPNIRYRECPKTQFRLFSKPLNALNTVGWK